MVNAIVILILILIAIFAIRGTIKHMKGETEQVRETCDR